MAYDLSELKTDLTIMSENIERIMAYEDNNDVSEEIRSRLYENIKDVLTQCELLEDEINDGIYEQDAPLWEDDDEDDFLEEDY